MSRLRRLLPLLALVSLLAACGGGEDSADDLARRALKAISEPGSVFHATADDGSEVWIDAEKQLYRGLEKSGAVFLLSVGEGWTKTSYDPFENALTSEDLSPTGERPRIDDPAVSWLEPLGALAFGRDLVSLGKTVSDGRSVVALEVRSPIVAGGALTGRSLVGRVELDPESYLPVAFQRRVELPPGQTPNPDALPGQTDSQQPKQIRYAVTEFIRREELAADFFSSKLVEEQIITLPEKLAQMRDMGIAPYWLGESFESASGKLALPDKQESVFVETEKGEASFHYLLEVTGAGPSGLVGESVIIRLGKAGQATFGQPSIQEFAGALPEGRRQVTVRGGPATVYTSLLTPAALPCPTATVCPKTDASLYHRLQLTIDSTLVQIESFARVDETGADQNGYNTQAGIIALAEALTAAQ